MPVRILVSACLLGAPVRYDGTGRPLGHPVLERWRAEGRLVPVCPEMLGGLPTPRPAAEIAGGGGDAVLDGQARIVTGDGSDVTSAFVDGARAALAAAEAHGCAFALLMPRSPSCGLGLIHDGTFSGTLVPGRGTTAALLARAGLAVFGAGDIDALADAVARAERAATPQTTAGGSLAPAGARPLTGTGEDGLTDGSLHGGEPQ